MLHEESLMCLKVEKLSIYYEGQPFEMRMENVMIGVSRRHVHMIIDMNGCRVRRFNKLLR